MKRQGKIKHLGFSFHDTYQVFTQILNDYDWDFVQIQLNYLDWQNQGAEQLYRELEKRNLPVMVMEPVRGGYLATIDEQRAKPFWRWSQTARLQAGRFAGLLRCRRSLLCSAA